MPSVDIQWPEDGARAWYNPFWEEIHLSDAYTWKEDTHAHEYGHHFLNNFSVSPEPDYCNGICDDDECGHCTWCQETESVALTEGWPDWIAHVQVANYGAAYGLPAVFRGDLEFIQRCSKDLTLHDPTRTEGLFGAILQDIWDSNNEADGGGYGLPDALSLGSGPIFTVSKLDQPTTAMGFLQAFRARYPEYTVQLWQTAYNNHLDLDTQNPTNVAGLTSSDHTPSVPSTDATISLSWNSSSDDWSGVIYYDFIIDRPDPQPDTVFALTSTVAATYHLPPGTYFIKVRSRDRSGRTSPYAVAGPYVIITPTPADLATVTPAGWANPVVPRPAGDASAGSVPSPTSLSGNTATTYINYAYANQGQQAPLWGADCWLLLDGGLLGSKFAVTPSPGQVGTVVNRGPFTVRGGRHYLGEWLDTFDQWSESDETNNVWGHPWVWSPVSFTGGPGNLLRRGTPPGPTDGWWTVKDGSPLFATCDGIRWPATTTWNMVWLAAYEDTSDFDCRLHFPSTGPQSGFDVVRGTSQRGPGCLELLIVNRNVWSGDLDWDIGVSNANGGGGLYAARRTSPTSLTVGGGTWEYVLPDSEYATLFSTYLYPSYGPVTVSAQGDPADGPFYLAHVTPTFAYGGLSDPSVVSYASDSTGLARMQIDPPAAGDHGIVLYRNPKDGRGARTISLIAELTPPDLVTTLIPGWHSTLVPRPAYDGTPSSVPLPDTLHGNVASTFFNFTGANDSPAAIPASVTGEILLDGVPFLDVVRSSLAAMATWTVNAPLPMTVGGGRHTLTLAFDPANVWHELFETNNRYGEQYVWSPLPMGLDSPVTRNSPPDRVGGWADVSSGEPLFFNTDGLRTPVFPGGAATWGGVALMPGAASNVDLQLHETFAGTKSGFAENLGVSSWGVGQSDFELLNFGLTPRRAFDVGVVGTGVGSEDYTVEVTASEVQALPPGGVLGPFTLPAGRILKLTEVALLPGNYTIRLLPVSGSVNLGLSVHAPDVAFQSQVAARRVVLAQ